MILETIVTTVSPEGVVNCAPMGVEWSDDVLVLKPFLDTTTYRNIAATGTAVVHLVDDVRMYAEAALANRVYASEPAKAVKGVVLSNCCSWREVRVTRTDASRPRARIDTHVVYVGKRREFVGFNRAKHAVLEATIHATRLHLLAPEFVEGEMARLQTIVDKTAGPDERSAMAFVLNHVRSSTATQRMVTGAQPRETVVVEAPGRLHFGVLNLEGSRGRWFGGLGTASPSPPLIVSASHADGPDLLVEGDDVSRAATFARRVLEGYHLTGGVRIRVREALPNHVGLGSGTQLGLAVARALAELFGQDTDVERLAALVGRSRRSAVGMWVFDGGGLVLEGGRHRDTGRSPLLARVPLPPAWRAVVVIPTGITGLSGPPEEAAFEALAQGRHDTEHVSHLVLMGLLPAVLSGDIAAFGEALEELQQITGRWFAPVQGGAFSAASQGIVDQLRGFGAEGVGQSSWGPVVYGLVEDEDRAQAVVGQLTRWLGNRASVHSGPFRTEGARVWREHNATGT